MRLRDLFLSPLYIAGLFSGQKSFSENPIIGSARLNRRGLHIWRVKASHALARWRRRTLSHRVSAHDRAAFAKDGFVFKPDFLPASVFADLKSQLRAASFEAFEMQEGNAITRRVGVNDDLRRKIPALDALFNHPEWKALTRYIASFGGEPALYIQTIIAQADAASHEDPQTALHIDTFHPTMKAWFFLHDVADDEGPFTYVAGSHRVTRRRLAWHKRQSMIASMPNAKRGGAFRIAAHELPRLGLPQARRFAVKANSLVVGDTFGFHARAHSSKATVRIEIYASARPNPFNPLSYMNLGTMPIIHKQLGHLYFKLHEILCKWGWAKPVWRRVAPAPILPPHF